MNVLWKATLFASACALLICGWIAPKVALAVTPAAPAWSVQSKPQPTTFSESDCPTGGQVGFCDHILNLFTNVGGTGTQGPITITDQVPTGLSINEASVRARDLETDELLACSVSGQTVECVHEESVAPGDILEMIFVVEVESGAPSGSLGSNLALVTGGGAAPASNAAPISVDVPPTFGLTEFGFTPYSANGTTDLLAGDHPYGLSTSFEFPSVHFVETFETFQESKIGTEPLEDPKSALAYLPLGLVGDPTIVPTCDLSLVEKQTGLEACPKASRIGTAVLNVEHEGLVATVEQGEVTPIYNVPAEQGYPAEFAFTYKAKLVVVYASLVHLGGPGGGYALRVGSAGIPAVWPLRVFGATLHFFGEPARHNGGQVAPKVFLTNPTNCSGPLATRFVVNSWQNPRNWVSAEETVYPQLTGCDSLQFHPTLGLKPETRAADTPSGYEVEVKVPQAPNAAPTLATPNLKDATVALPSGLVLSPSAANGLSSCAATGPRGINIGSDQVGPAGEDLGNPEATELGAGHPGGNSSPYDDGIYHTAPGHCPASSQIGELEIETPLLEKPLLGHVYVAQPNCGGAGRNPCTDADAANGNLYGIYLEAAGSGVIVKLHGKVAADPRTGQLTGTFTENPQLPFQAFRLRFQGGPLAPLANPPTCGSFKATSTFTPWSTPYTPDAKPTSSFAIGSGPNGSACVSSESQAPNAPSFEAGTVSPFAGSYSPFVLKLSREDGSQRLRALNLKLPAGLLGKLAGISYCPDTALAAAAAKSGAQEQAAPSCSSQSRLGSVTVGAGPGSQPYYVQGSAYLAGPYKGAPLSMAVVTPAVAGPFDLGTVVVRSGLYVNPETTQITIKSDPLPSILAGTPLDLRSVAVKIDRSDFTLNPTSCEEKTIGGEAISLAGQSAPLTNRFQVGGCKGLDFAPKLALRLLGPTHRSAHPTLRAVLTMRKGEANISRAAVTLPKTEFLENAHIRTVCTRVQYAVDACPAQSVYGYAKAWSPLLDKPLGGPVYLRSSSHPLPDLVASLDGQIHVDLVGRIDSVHARIRNTFDLVPDAPVSKFMLTMQGGKKGLLVNNTELCKARPRAIAKFDAQNGKTHDFNPLAKVSCGRRK
jgi:hypothetical protein